MGSFIKMGKVGLVEKLKGPAFGEEDVAQGQHLPNRKALGPIPSTTHKSKFSCEMPFNITLVRSRWAYRSHHECFSRRN